MTCFWTGFTIGLTIFGFIGGLEGAGNVFGAILAALGLGLMWDAYKTGTTGVKQCLGL